MFPGGYTSLFGGLCRFLETTAMLYVESMTTTTSCGLLPTWTLPETVKSPPDWQRIDVSLGKFDGSALRHEEKKGGN